MPPLQNPKHEAFAQARARGAYLEDAYEDAGFVRDRSHASRLALTQVVAERIAELKAEFAPPAECNPANLVAALIRIAKASEALETPAAMKEARLALLDAARVAREKADDRDREHHGYAIIPR